jgi:AbrB family looped-hinge helix DNA binding protein
MKVTTKGQVTIPQTIREKLRIYPGSEVEFILEGESVMLKPIAAAHQKIPAFIERLVGSATLKMSTDEIMALTRQ